MPRILAFVVVFLLLHFNCQAQLEALFAPIDCREHAEWFYEEPVLEAVASVSVMDSTLMLASDDETIVADTLNEWQTWAYVENYAFGKDRGALPMITDLKALHPYFRDKIIQLIAICKAKGINLAIVETYRTHAKQNEYKSKGRAYTNSIGGKSKHQYGLAVDVVPIVNSTAVWDNVVLWKKIGAIGEKLGLRWGGRWRKPYDPGHFEWTGGLTSYHLLQGLFPDVPNCDKHYPCLEEDLNTLRTYWKEWETVQSAMTRR